MNAFISNIKYYLKNSREYSFVRMALEFAAIAFLAKFVLYVILRIIFGNFETAIELINKSFNPTEAVILTLLVAPVIETILYQAIPINLLSRYTNKSIIPLSISVILFTGAHAINTLVMSIVLIPMAILLAWSMYVWSQKSWWMGMLITWLIHLLYNSLVIGFSFVNS